MAPGEMAVRFFRTGLFSSLKKRDIQDIQDSLFFFKDWWIHFQIPGFYTKPLCYNSENSIQSLHDSTTFIFVEVWFSEVLTN